MNATVFDGFSFSISQSMETRSIEVYPLGGFNFSKLETDFEDKVDINVTSESVLFVNQVLITHNSYNET